MFRKILLSYFPQIEDSEISPINFHLKLLSWELFYEISVNHSLENRRSIQFDSNFRYFESFQKKSIKNKKDKDFYYSYKSFANLNWYNNYSVYVWISTILILTLKTYHKHFDPSKFANFINPLLYWFQYLLVSFFARFKEYELKSDKKDMEFMLNLLKEIIFKLELNKDKRKKPEKAMQTTNYIISILKKEPEFLTFIYNTSKEFRSVFEEKKFTDILLYEYLSSSSINDFQKNKELQESVLQNCRKIFIERFTNFVSTDMIILMNVIIWERWHISYLTNTSNTWFIDYLVWSLNHIDDIDLNDDFYQIIDKVLDFKKRWYNFIEALKEFNLDNIDFNLDLSLWIDKVQEMMSKEMMDAVQNISSINEQFLDYFILLISRKINSNWDSSQFLFQNQEWEISKTYWQTNYGEIKANYINLDKQYFYRSFLASKKKAPSDLDLNYNYVDKIIAWNILQQARKRVLLDFQKKSHKEYIKIDTYMQVLRKYFEDDISKILKSKNIEKDYLKKYYWDNFIKQNINEESIRNFKENIYYSDFLVYYKFLQFTNIKFKDSDILLASRLRDSIFGYLILRKNSKRKEDIDKLYIKWVDFYDRNLTLNLKEFYYYFEEQYWQFLDFFVKVKQNQNFSRIVEEFSIFVKYKNFFIFENTKDISYYNKRIFKL